MTAHPACPEDAQLVRLLSDASPPGEGPEVLAHFEGCASCHARISRLAGDEKAWHAVRALASSSSAEAGPALRRVIETFQQAIVTGTTAPSRPDDFLSFLSPSEEGLGRMDHYLVLDVVGRGGMGVVLKALDEKLNRVVALKLLLPQLAARPSARQRFVREARAGAAVDHENVVAIYGVTEDAPLPYIAMQFVAGPSLQQLLDDGHRFPVPEVVQIGRQVALGLAAAHARGVVHRDVKPANVLVEPGQGRLKITDFGLALVASDVGLTDPGVVAGTPLYMAPEQANGGRVDHRTDLFSLGSVLYACCTGTPPFSAETPAAVLRLVSDRQPVPVRSLNPDAPPWLCDVVAGLMEKVPESRIQSAQEAARRFELGPAGTPPALRRPFLWLGAVLALLAALALATWGLRAPVSQPPGSPEAGAVPRTSLLDALKPEDVPLPFRFVAGLGRAERAPGELVAVLSDPRFMVSNPGPASWPALSRDGKILALPCGPHVDLFSAETGAPLAVLTGLPGRVFSVAFHPDGNRLAVATWDAQHDVLVWGLAQGKVIQTLKGHRAALLRVVYSPDGNLLASSSDDHTAIVWDARSGDKKWALVGHQGDVGVVAFSPDGKRVVTGSRDTTVKIWSAETGALITTLPGHTGSVTALAFSPDGALLASGSEHESIVWGWKGLKRSFGAKLPAAWLDFMPDGNTLLTAGHDFGEGNEHQAHRIDAATGKDLGTLRLKNSGGYAVFLLGADGKRLYTMRLKAGEHGARVVSPVTGERLFPYSGHFRSVYSVAVTPDGEHVASGGADRRLLLWKLARLKGGLPEARLLLSCQGEVVSVVFSGDGSLLAAGSLDGKVHLWSMTDNRLVGTLRGYSRQPSGLAFSPGGAVLAAGGENGEVRLWDVATRRARPPLRWHDGPVRSVAFSHDGELLASAGRDGTLRVGVWKSGRRLAALHRKTPISAVAFHPEGKTIASVGDAPNASLYLWDFASGREVIHPIHDANTLSVAYGPTGKLLATGHSDARLRLWEPLGEARRLRTWGPGAFGFAVHQAAFTPEGRHLVTANANGMLYVLRLATPGQEARTFDLPPE